ncbi:MAG: DUF3761 domain-containing protein [Actinobacteria bacterium]|nr:MAG: DUF3761 domain-containing protein [Actinomycetota bacterium]
MMIRRVVITAALLLSIAAGSASAKPSVSSLPTVTAQSAIHRIAFAAPYCSTGYYKNVNGICVHRPSSNPSGATARCRDGSYSYSRHASGTCSHHGGVLRWIRHP